MVAAAATAADKSHVLRMGPGPVMLNAEGCSTPRKEHVLPLSLAPAQRLEGFGDNEWGYAAGGARDVSSLFETLSFVYLGRGHLTSISIDLHAQTDVSDYIFFRTHYGPGVLHSLRKR